MKIRIDNKEIDVIDPTKNIVDIAASYGIGITAPCYKNNRRHSCCKACLIIVDGMERYACCTKPTDGMEIIYDRVDLADIRKERLAKYAKNIKSDSAHENTCCSSDVSNTKNSCGCGDDSCCQ